MVLSRMVNAIALGVACLWASSGATLAQEPPWRHAAALVGEPKYPADFKRFDYVNPNAPKGGLVRFSEVGTFDNLNLVPPKGSLPGGLGLIYDTLMSGALDEISTEYGELADGLKYPADYSWVTYRLRGNGRWHDGKPITAEDVIFSFNALKEHNPSQAFYYRHVTKAEKTGEREITFTFDEKGNRELPQIVGQLTILPKHFWEGTDAAGNRRDISKTSLEIPLGSGPYKIKSVSPGRSISFERVADYWGKDLPSHVGADNFDEIRYEYFRDDTVEFQAFSADQIDWRAENTARVWATAYDFPAVRDGRVKLEMFEEPYRTSGVMSGFILNINRGGLQDRRVREALNLAMPFEDMNKTLFFDQYERINSFFFGLPLAASGLPEGKEKAILESVRDKLPPEALTRAYVNPVNESANQQRDNLRQALSLLSDAGWQLKGNSLVNAKSGEPMSVEILLNGPTFERVALAYQTALKKIGIDLKLRTVDASQYENRVRSRDFDIIYGGWSQSSSPGNEQQEFFGSEAAKRQGSRNYTGIADPAIDALITRVLQSSDRDDLVTATHALDRALLWQRIVVPGWTLRKARIARWDRFSHPAALPQYSIGFPTVWWYDKNKAAKIGVRQ